MQASASPQPPSPQKKLVHWADLVRVLAIYLVVIIHTSGQLTNAWGRIPEAQWIAADAFGGVARIGVPLFFMLSGYLLLPRSESLGSFYGRRMPKIVVPFIVWSAIYLSLNCLGQPGLCTMDYLRPYLLLQRTYFHLWFLYSLTGIYFIIPLLRLMIRPDTDRSLLWYLIGLWIVFQPLRTLMDQFLHWSININAPLSTGFLPYFVLGLLLGELPLTRRLLWLAVGLFIAGSLVTVAGTYLLTRASGQFNGYFYDYVTIGVIPATAGGFLLLRALSDVGWLASDRAHALLRTLAGSTFGLYLVHILILSGLDRLHVNTFMGAAVWSIPLIATLVFVLSWLIARLLQAIPLVRSIVPG